MILVSPSLQAGPSPEVGLPQNWPADCVRADLRAHATDHDTLLQVAWT